MHASTTLVKIHTHSLDQAPRHAPRLLHTHLRSCSCTAAYTCLLHTAGAPTPVALGPVLPCAPAAEPEPSVSLYRAVTCAPAAAGGSWKDSTCCRRQEAQAMRQYDVRRRLIRFWCMRRLPGDWQSVPDWPYASQRCLVASSCRFHLGCLFQPCTSGRNNVPSHDTTRISSHMQAGCCCCCLQVQPGYPPAGALQPAALPVLWGSRPWCG